MVISHVVDALCYMPPMIQTVTLHAPQLSASIEYHSPAPFREFLEFDLTPQTLCLVDPFPNYPPEREESSSLD